MAYHNGYYGATNPYYYNNYYGAPNYGQPQGYMAPQNSYNAAANMGAPQQSYNSQYTQQPVTQPVQQPVQQSQQPAPQQPAANNFVWAWVQGEGGAQAYPVGAGNTVLLMDSDNPKLYMKSSDANGRPQAMEVRYLVTEEEYGKLHQAPEASHDMPQYVTQEDFEKYIADADQKFVIRKEKNSNGK